MEFCGEGGVNKRAFQRIFACQLTKMVSLGVFPICDGQVNIIQGKKVQVSGERVR